MTTAAYTNNHLSEGLDDATLAHCMDVVRRGLQETLFRVEQVSKRTNSDPDFFAGERVAARREAEVLLRDALEQTNGLSAERFGNNRHTDTQQKQADKVSVSTSGAGDSATNASSDALPDSSNSKSSWGQRLGAMLKNSPDTLKPDNRNSVTAAPTNGPSGPDNDTCSSSKKLNNMLKPVGAELVETLQNVIGPTPTLTPGS